MLSSLGIISEQVTDVLGFTLRGWPAAVLGACYFVMYAAVALGLWRLRNSARKLGIAMVILMLVNDTLALPRLLPATFPALLVSVYVGLSMRQGLILWFLIKRRGAFLTPLVSKVTLPVGRLFVDWNVPWRVRDALKIILGSYACMMLWIAMLGFLLGLLHPASRISPSDIVQLVRSFMTSSGLDLWILLSLATTWLWLSRTILQPLGLRTAAFFPASVRPAGAETSGGGTAALHADVGYGGKLFFWSLGAVVGLIAAIVAGISVVAIQSGQAPDQAAAAFLMRKQHETSILLNPQLGWLRACLMVFGGPFIEELVYRGCLYAALRKRFGTWSSMFMSAAVFAISHRMYAANLPQVFVIGCFCAFAFEQTRSLRTPLVIHACWNLLGVIVSNPWIALGFLVPVGVCWWLGRKPTVSTSRRRGWKIYAIVLTLMMTVGYAMDAGVAWQAVMEVPLVAAVVLYAWRWPSGAPAWWRIYGVFYPAWVAFLLWVNAIPSAHQQPWQRPFLSSDPSQTVTDILIELAGYALALGPAFTIVWRLALERAGRELGKERELVGVVR